MGSSNARKGGEAIIVKDFRLPWTLRMTFAAGILIPVLMIVHSSDHQLKDMKRSLQQQENARLSVVEERDLLARAAAQSAVQAQELAGDMKVMSDRKLLVEQQLEQSGKWLDDERRIRTGLQHEVNKLSAKQNAYRKREGELHDIIELLEGEVASVEGRLKKLKAEQNDARVVAKEAIEVRGQEAVPGEISPGNRNLGSSASSQDAQLIALLNEIGTMNSEIEKVRQERDRLKNELDRLTASAADDGRLAIRRSKKQGRPIFAGFGKDND
jgi:chromosome segregation ATPase